MDLYVHNVWINPQPSCLGTCVKYYYNPPSRIDEIADFQRASKNE